MSLKLELDGRVYEVTILARRPRLVVSVDGRPHAVETVGEPDESRGAIAIDGVRTAFARAETADGALVRIDGRTFDVRRVDAAAESSLAGGGAHVVRAPMPGVVVAIHKVAGDSVERGEAVVTIESMKLQMKLGAPRDGEIAEVAAREGDGFEKDAVLARLVAPAAEG